MAVLNLNRSQVFKSLATPAYRIPHSITYGDTTCD